MARVMISQHCTSKQSLSSVPSAP
ncbi:hypothetical protein E2C01_040979 [Portunus trituberculatus]|uniref:Uncharacterized protein n=1 Tax=Portunus trituberculatus TaxID=210409 RepID=A0A5B7FPP8_PORTR|nr:hypothetical protein [Portunus trituberculatus]